ncbi:MAG: matrixin family metalloprotease [Planctomycetota bacterium]
MPQRPAAALVTTLVTGAAVTQAHAIEIVMDYSLDSNNFFDPSTADGLAARTAMQAVADRYSRIITSSLGAAEINDVNDARIGFINPSTGSSIQISGAASAASDSLIGIGAAEADIYLPGGRTFEADTLTIFAGATSLGAAGLGGSGSGQNITTVFDDPNSHLNRGFNVGSGSLPTWGGFVSFDIGRDWNFSLDTATVLGQSDFYSIAMHEVGHVLGLAIDVSDFTDDVTGDQYFGPNTIAAANADNGTSLTDIDLVAANNLHFADNDGNGSTIPADPDAIQSFIFELGDPNLVGTVGLGTLQDLLMEPIQNTFFNLSDPTQSITRTELTNVDVASLQDVGWTVIPEPSSGLLVMTGIALLARRRRDVQPQD